MSPSANYPIDDYVPDVSSKILDLLAAEGAKKLEITLERSGYARWTGVIKVTVGYRERASPLETTWKPTLASWTRRGRTRRGG